MDLIKARCLVTGASGFLGANLTAELTQRGCCVTSVSRQPRTIHPAGANQVTADLTDPGCARALLLEYKPDIIFHLAGNVSAAENPALVIPMFQANSCATVYLLAAASEIGCQRVITVSSAEEHAGELPSLSPYAIAKHVSSVYAEYFRRNGKLAVYQLLLHQAYGPHQATSKLIPYIIKAYLRGEQPVLGTPSRECDFIFVRDVIAALTMAAETLEDPGILEVGTGRQTSVLDVTEQIRMLVGAAMPPRVRAQADRQAPSISKLVTQSSAGSWGWFARTDLTSGLQQTIDWYSHERELNDTNCRATAR